tara:strand:+ start:183 stop:713 length:531 start_codon:yes stop_codon:yes gene_type:complete
MAGFQTKTFIKHDDYMTPKSAWENIKHLIPKDKKIWEAFYGDGTSGKYLEELGFDVYHEDIDFFENDIADCVISNPPFGKIKLILERLVRIKKPFILIMPSSKINTQYFRRVFIDIEKPQLIIPRKRIQFKKMIDGKIDTTTRSQCNFDCFYYCWKMNLDNNITWLNDAVEMKKKK